MSTESQNRSGDLQISEELELWRSPSPTPLLKEAHPEQVAQDQVQAGSEYLQTQLAGLTQGKLSNRGLALAWFAASVSFEAPKQVP